MARQDGRKALEMRELDAELGQLDRADGSAKFSFGGNSAMASVSGPIEVRIREELPDKATFEVVHRPLEGIAATPSKALVNTLSTVFPPLLSLGQHPRSLIQLVIQTLSSSPSPAHSSSDTTQNTWPPESFPIPAAGASMSGMYFSAKATALNAGSLALLDTASVAIRAIPVAISLADLGDELVVDPTREEEDRSSSRYVFAWAFGKGISSEEKGDMDVDGDTECEIVWTEAEGEFTRNQYEAAAEQGKEAAKEILAFYRSTLQSHLDKRLQLSSQKQ